MEKRICIDGTEYELYGAGENPAVSIYPHMIEVSTGQIPKGRQLRLLKTFLKANGVTPIPGANTHWCVEAAIKLVKRDESRERMAPESAGEAEQSGDRRLRQEDCVRRFKLPSSERKASAAEGNGERIALISCSKLKKPYLCEARELYSASRLFSLSYAYARENADRIYILSAKYGLVGENERIAPYDETLNEKSLSERKAWARRVTDQLRQVCDISRDTFLILAGKNYYENLIQQLPYTELPLGRLPLGQRMEFLQRQLKNREETVSGAENAALWLHRLFWQLPVYDWQTIDRIPFRDGIYIVYEKGETYRGGPRIVRVGTHTSPYRLKQRLKDHFVRENHNGSIFRKNIGKAMLNREKDPYLAIWTLDTSKEPHRGKENPEKEAEIESRVSAYMRGNFSFSVFPVTDKEERLRMEEAIIATLNREEDFRASDSWLGNSSTEKEIRESGMWLKQGLDAKPLTHDEMVRLCQLVK